MIYYNIGNVTIRDVNMADVEALTAAELEQGCHWATTEQTASRLPARDAGKCIVMICECEGEPAGYVSLYWNAPEGPFKDKQIPEVVDFNVLPKHRRKGLGNTMLNVCEQLAATRCDKICLGVGLYRDYGTAQRMYVKRGYVPDGSGVWYCNENVDPGKDVCNDDDLVLFLSKDLR